ncbi:MAG: type I-C CRISPR-associated protein Cas8c/Csd1 [Acidobacteriaceae bacterium]|nr:type I-C CRISPR-associated protein Cas8c/Csd1 [Acidobacteriaceae bacterium]
MSWIQKLVETYDACFGQPQFADRSLTPIDHVEQNAHIEIAIDENGNFLRAAVVQKEPTLIPVTEKSAGRTSGACAHPLSDKIRYVAKDFSSDDHQLYLKQIGDWSESSNNATLRAIERYVKRGSVANDLVNAGVMTKVDDGSWKKSWSKEEIKDAPLAKLLVSDAKTKERDQGDAFVRWRVEIPGKLESAVWKDLELQRDWADFNAKSQTELGLCLSSGCPAPLAENHPRRLRHGGDGAKLISSNDTKGFTFRGRFKAASEAYGLSSAATQKAHNALRWLIARQGAKNGDQVVVAWSVKSADAPPVLVDSWQFFRDAEDNPEEAQEGSYEGDAGQHFALRLKKAIGGYKQKLDDSADIVVMGLDSATPGRMAILFYRELKEAEFLIRLERWHTSLAWQQNIGKDRRFIGAPAPRDIEEVCYGQRVDEKLRKATQERLLPCIVDGRPLPRDLVLSAVRRAANRAAVEHWEFERNLGVACSLYRGAHPKENYSMSLDESRTSRDYLYGRLLALADSIEGLALHVAKVQRDTTAARLMQRFADHPYSTWRTIELQLTPYIAQLRSSRAAALQRRQSLIDGVYSLFEASGDESTFLDNRPLSGEFLLGFHSQREALRLRKDNSSDAEPEATPEEGDKQ